MRACVASLLLTLTACASSPPSADAAPPSDLPRAVDTAPGDRVDATAPDDAEAEAPCARPPSERPANSVCVREVRGQVLDLNGAPRVDIPVTVCGPVCWLSRTDADGRFSVSVGDFINTTTYAVLAHGRPDYASVYAPLPVTVSGAGVITYSTPLRLPLYTNSGGRLDGDAGVARVDLLEVRVPVGAELEFDLEDFKLGELGRRLRVAEVPVNLAPPFAQEARAQAVWALAPFALTSTRPLALRLPNTLGLAPGARVDVFAMGGDILPPESNAGRAIPVGVASVSANGQLIETAPMDGPRRLTWIALRARSD